MGARGERQLAIERITGHRRSTIRRWLRAAREPGWEPGQGEPDETLATVVAKRVRAVRDEAVSGEGQRRLLPYGEQIRDWLEGEDERRGLQLAKVQQLFVRQGVGDTVVMQGGEEAFELRRRKYGFRKGNPARRSPGHADCRCSTAGKSDL
jgi:hypothetical protein